MPSKPGEIKVGDKIVISPGGPLEGRTGVVISIDYGWIVVKFDHGGSGKFLPSEVSKLDN